MCVCLSVFTCACACVCVRACVCVCDTGVFFFTGARVFSGFFPWTTTALWEGGYCPDGIFYLEILSGRIVVVCLSVCLYACACVCDTGVFYFPGFPRVFPWTSATKALWEGGYFPDGFTQWFLSEENCNNRTIGRGL